MKIKRFIEKLKKDPNKKMPSTSHRVNRYYMNYLFRIMPLPQKDKQNIVYDSKEIYDKTKTIRKRFDLSLNITMASAFSILCYVIYNKINLDLINWIFLSVPLYFISLFLFHSYLNIKIQKKAKEKTVFLNDFLQNLDDKTLLSLKNEIIRSLEKENITETMIRDVVEDLHSYNNNDNIRDFFNKIDFENIQKELAISSNSFLKAKQIKTEQEKIQLKLNQLKESINQKA